MKKKGKSKSTKPRAASRRSMLPEGVITIPLGSGGSTKTFDQQAQQWNVHVVAELDPDTNEFVYNTTDDPDRAPSAVAFNGGTTSATAGLIFDVGDMWVGDIDGLGFEPMGVRVTARFVGAPQTVEQPFAEIGKKPRGEGQKKKRAARTAKKAARKRG